MDKIKWIAILFLFLSAAAFTFFSVNAQPSPPQTELIDKKIETIKNMQVVSYRYLSELPQKEIADFYRNFLVNEEGLKEREPEESEGRLTLTFIRGDGSLKTVVVNIFGKYAKDLSEELGGKISYYLTITENQDILGLSLFKPEHPQILNFAPVYQGSEQFCFYERPSDWKVVSYLTKGNLDDVADFYRKEMKMFKWELTSDNTYDGRFNLFDTFVMGDPNSKEKSKGEDIWPGVEVEVRKLILVFKQKSKRQECVIHIVQFNDTPDVLRSVHINPAPLERYGNIFINLIVYKDKN